MRIQKSISFLIVLAIAAWPCLQAAAQTPAPATQEHGKKHISTTPVIVEDIEVTVEIESQGEGSGGTKQERRRSRPTPRIAPVIVENLDISPQIVTILHRLNGLKVFRLLVRSTDRADSIAALDEAFRMTDEVHTNVIAGLALDGGKTIAAWLPEAEAELPPAVIPFAPKGPMPPPSPPVTKVKDWPHPGPAPEVPGVAHMGFGGNLLEPADLKVITRDGKRLLGSYIGLDGLTGLSVITLENNSNLLPVADSKEADIGVGQRLRVFGPRRAARPDPAEKGAMYVRIGETDATVVKVARSPSGGLARLRVRSPKLSAANIGGVAINDAGATVGIVDAVQGSEATIVPVSVVRRAVARVMARQASVPRPWLGVKGEPVGQLSLDQIVRLGYQVERARELAQKRQGIMLTYVTPGSPAALKKLKAGDVILSVNNADVWSSDEFSWLLNETGPGNLLNVTVARPEQLAAEAVQIALSVSPDPFFGFRMFQGQTSKRLEPGSLMAHGVETIAIKPKVAMRFGATGGLLVVYVQPSSSAFEAGLRPGDVIEAIDGQQVSSRAQAMELLKKPAGSFSFNIVRNKQKLVYTIATTNPIATPNK